MTKMTDKQLTVMLDRCGEPMRSALRAHIAALTTERDALRERVKVLEAEVESHRMLTASVCQRLSAVGQRARAWDNVPGEGGETCRAVARHILDEDGREAPVDSSVARLAAIRSRILDREAAMLARAHRIFVQALGEGLHQDAALERAVVDQGRYVLGEEASEAPEVREMERADHKAPVASSEPSAVEDFAMDRERLRLWADALKAWTTTQHVYTLEEVEEAMRRAGISEAEHNEVCAHLRK